MAEIDSLGSNLYYAGVQNTTNEALKKNRKTEETKSTKKTKFGDILHKTEDKEPEFSVNGLPPEIETMSVEEATNYLVDAVNLAGNDLSEQITEENIKKFKSAVSSFILFVAKNNYQVTSKSTRKMGRRALVSPSSFFSNYQIPPHKVNPVYQIKVINEKLAALTAATLEGQKSNLYILAQVDEIKGLIIDLIE